jgi:hypothetical protein
VVVSPKQSGCCVPLSSLEPPEPSFDIRCERWEDEGVLLSILLVYVMMNDYWPLVALSYYLTSYTVILFKPPSDITSLSLFILRLSSISSISFYCGGISSISLHSFGNPSNWLSSKLYFTQMVCYERTGSLITSSSLICSSYNS